MIAHRLETAVAYADKILVLDQGKRVEYDNAFNLLVKHKDDQTITNDTLFAEMVKSCKERVQRQILDKARENYNKLNGNNF